MYAFFLLGAIVLVFLAQIVFLGFCNPGDLICLNPAELPQEPWTIITSMFLHGGMLHLFFNGFALYMFGPYLEQIIGSRRFLLVYLLSGIAGGLAYAATYYLGIMPASIPALGASGAIFGILGAVAVLRPNLPIIMWFVPMPMKFAVIVWIALSLVETFNITGVAGAAHLGGLVVGAVMAYAWLRMGSIQWVEEGYS
ncbi:rhomboid family intramembrane serine protease [Candidatus Micrarchaeota archaeon]|nr:rhomboid family intramembrane serine protease [Candidatus Micrarchaeota archaeon]